MKKIIIAILVLGAVVFLGVKGKDLLEKRTAEVENTPLPTQAPITVSTVLPKQGTLTHEVALLAQVLADKSITLSSKMAGYINTLYVEESQKISKGDMLLQIDNEEILSTIRSLQSVLKTQESDLGLATTIHARNRKLFEIGGLPKEKLELSALSLQAKQSTIEGTQQKIAQLEHQRTYLALRAPFDGQIDTIFLREGDLAVTGKPLMRISSLKKKLLLSYSAGGKNRLKIGDGVYWGETHIGTIKRYYTSAKNGLNAAEVSLVKPLDAMIGSSINITVHTQEQTGCIVPNDALLHKKEGTYVMQEINGIFAALAVTVALEEQGQSILSPCPARAVAQASESTLSSLPAYTHIKVIGETYAE